MTKRVSEELLGGATVLTANKITELTTKYPGLGEDTFVHECDYNQAENSRRERLRELAALRTEKPIVTVDGDGDVTLVTFNGETVWQRGKKPTCAHLREALEALRASVAEKDAYIKDLEKRREEWVDEYVLVRDERDALKAQLADAVETLQKLDEYCDDSDEAQYGTLSTRLVRGLASSCLKRLGAAGWGGGQ